MSSLQAHLERHDLAASPLGFRRDCPLCRAERVQGHLPSASVVPPRARAAMAAALLAGNAVAPGIAIAADGQGLAAPAPAAPPAPQASDLTVGDGGAAPVSGDQDVGPDSANGGDQDSDGSPPSGRDTETEARSDSVGEGGGGPAGSGSSTAPSNGAPADSDDSPTVQQAPAEEPVRDSAHTDADTPDRPADDGPAAAPAPAADDGPAAAQAPAANAGEAAAPAPASDDVDAAPPAPASDDVDAAAPSESELNPGAGPSSGGSTVAPRKDAASAQPTGGQERHRSSSARGASPTARAVTGSDRRGAPDAKRGSDRAGRTARDGGQLVADETAAGSARERTSSRRETESPDTYQVRPGDSLWRIAERRLGSSATATQTAEEVTRLWELNRQRIGTGNPDLIFSGQTLRM